MRSIPVGKLKGLTGKTELRLEYIREKRAQIYGLHTMRQRSIDGSPRREKRSGCAVRYGNRGCPRRGHPSDRPAVETKTPVLAAEHMPATRHNPLRSVGACRTHVLLTIRSGGRNRTPSIISTRSYQHRRMTYRGIRDIQPRIPRLRNELAGNRGNVLTLESRCFEFVLTRHSLALSAGNCGSTVRTAAGNLVKPHLSLERIW